MTRAEPGAARTAARLEALGFAAITAPVLKIRPIAQAAPDLTGYSALAFTSPNGVTAFARMKADRSLPVFAVGDATAEAARTAGFADVTSAGGAVANLARLIRKRARGPVLAPGALEPAGDLRVLAGEIEVRTLAVYEAVETGTAAPEVFDAVLVHSPRGGRAVARTLGAGGGAERLAVAISRAAAAPLTDAAFARVRIAAEPAEGALLEALGNPGACV